MLVLASASPRRQRLLAQLGAGFESIPASVPEIPEPGEAAPAYALRVARAKVAAAATAAPGRWILGADTVVAVDGEILGKPRDRADAGHMLRRLSGRSHYVHTAVLLQSPDGRSRLEDVAHTRVVFRRLSNEEIERYLDSGEPADKAGAYAIQGGAASFVASTTGSYSNVVGLPLELVAPALREANLLRETSPRGR